MLSNTIKQKRKEKAGKWEVPLPKVRTSCIRMGVTSESTAPHLVND